MAFKFENALEESIGFGRYQMVLCAMAAWYGIPSAMNIVGSIFLSYRMNHRCLIPTLDNSSAFPKVTEAILQNWTIPFDEKEQQYSQCRRYNFSLNACDGNITCVNKTLGTIPCDYGFKYNKSIFNETVISEFDLVCNRMFLDSVSTALYMFGILCSGIIFGSLCDRFGRKVGMTVSGIGALAVVVAESFSPSIGFYSLCRLLLGFFSFGATLSTFVFVVEITPKKWRSLVSMANQMFFALGYILMSGVGFGFRNWRTCLRITTIFFAPFIGFLFLLPESPRWLFMTGQKEKGMKITKAIVRRNGGDIRILINPAHHSLRKNSNSNSEDENVKLRVFRHENDRDLEKKKHSILDVFRTAETRKITISMMFIWFVNSFVFYGISLNARALSGNIFINHALNGVMQIVGYVLCAVTMDRLGRRFLLAIMMAVAGIGMLVNTVITLLVEKESAWITVGLVAAFLGKLGISGSYAVTYTYTAELYPTVIRSNGFGVCSTVARIGGVIAPFVIDIGPRTFRFWIPNVIFFTFALAASFVTRFMLPETNNRRMLETISEAESFYKEF